MQCSLLQGNLTLNESEEWPREVGKEVQPLERKEQANTIVATSMNLW